MSSGRVPTSVMTLSIKLLLNVFQIQKNLFHAFYIQALSVMRGVIVQIGNLLLAFNKELFVVQVAVVRWNAIVAAHVFGLGHFFTRNQRFVKFFTVTGTNNLDGVVTSE